MSGDETKRLQPTHADENNSPAPPPADEALTASLRGFGPTGLAAMLAILAGDALVHPLSAVLVLGWARWSRTPWRKLGFVRPESWPREIGIGLLFGATLRIFLKAIVLPLLGAPAASHTYRDWVGNPAVVPFALYSIILGAGFGEETVFRGYLFERLGRLFGSGGVAKIGIVLLTSLVFGLAHYTTQGFPGVAQSTIVGLIFGGIYARTGRLWMLMIAHAAFDLAALATIYWDLEVDVAHLVFK